MRVFTRAPTWLSTRACLLDLRKPFGIDVATYHIQHMHAGHTGPV